MYGGSNTSFVNQEFMISGYKSSDLGISGCSIIKTGDSDNGMIQTPFISGSDIVETEIPRVYTRVYHFHKEEPLTLDLKFSLLEDSFTSNMRYQIATLFSGTTYKEFISVDDICKYYYVMCSNQANLFLANNDCGYFEINLRCAHPFALTRPYIYTFDLSTSVAYANVVIDNYDNVGDAYYYPQITFMTNSSTTGAYITNLSNNGSIFSFSGLNPSETIFVDNQKKQILSDSGSYRYSNFNVGWLSLIYGKNYLTLSPGCIYQFRCQFPYSGDIFNLSVYF